MPKVKVREGESLEQALRRFNRSTIDIVKEFRERAFFEKPSVLKKRAKAERARKIKRAQRFLRR